MLSAMSDAVARLNAALEGRYAPGTFGQFQLVSNLAAELAGR